MISTKQKSMTPKERKDKIAKLREEHQNYFETNGNTNALYIPKMAYRPSGKDELYVSFFPSELQRGEDIYTEFVSIEYDSEDPLRTLYFHKHNDSWKEDYELVTSNSGFERHLIPVSKLTVIKNIKTKEESREEKLEDDFFLPNPDNIKKDPMVAALNRIATALEKLANK